MTVYVHLYLYNNYNIYIYITHREIRARVQCSYIFILRLHPSFYPIHTKHPQSRPVVPSSIQRHRCQAQSAIEQPRDGHRFPGMDLPAVAPIGIQPTTPNGYPQQLPPTMVKMLRVYQPTATFIADKSKISDLAPPPPASHPHFSCIGASSKPARDLQQHTSLVGFVQKLATPWIAMVYTPQFP